MAVLVLGGNGFIGAPLVRGLQVRGEAVTILHRGGSPAPPGVEAVVGDRRDGAALERLVADRGVRIVIDLLAFTEADTRPVLEALSGAIDRYADQNPALSVSQGLAPWPGRPRAMDGRL